MAYDLTQRPFEESYKDQAKRLSAEAIASGESKSLEFRTRRGHISLLFQPTGRVEITWRDQGGIKEGWFMKDWTIATTLRKWNELVAS